MLKERGKPGLKVVDRYLGIPLVAIAGLCRFLIAPSRKSFASISRSKKNLKIGILAPGAIGDTVIASSLVADLRAAFPSSTITLFTSFANDSIAPMIPGELERVSLPIIKPWRAVKLLRKADLDCLIDVSPWPRINSLLSILSGALMTIGFKTKNQWRHYGYDVHVEHRSDRHQLANLRALLLPLGIKARNVPRLKNENVALPAELPSKPYVVFHAWPGGYRSRYKQWPMTHWVALAVRVVKSGNAVVLTGGPDDVDNASAMVEAMRAENIEPINLAGRASMPQTSAVLKKSKAVVSVDTGILHVAAAQDVPVIGLHGPSPSRRWGGVGKQVISIDSECPGSGFLDLGFEYPANPPDTMSAISPDRVWRALKPILTSVRPSNNATDRKTRVA